MPRVSHLVELRPVGAPAGEAFDVRVGGVDAGFVWRPAGSSWRAIPATGGREVRGLDDLAAALEALGFAVPQPPTRALDRRAPAGSPSGS